MTSYRDVRHEIERRWSEYWRTHDTFRTPNPGDRGFDPKRPKSVVLDMFPYPSAIGLHIGHPLGYIATDVYSRFLRMRGHNVLHAMGFDAFGLPAEQYAIQTGQHPRITTEQNIRNMLVQLGRLGLDHDRSRRFATTDPAYFRWTQWIFLQLFNCYYDFTVVWTDSLGRQVSGKARPISELADRLRSGQWRLSREGAPVPKDAPNAAPFRALSDTELDKALDAMRLAYIAEVPVNWCPMLGTVLSNEEVTNEGRSERGDYPVYRRVLEQWMLRISCYAERLLYDLDALDWPVGIVEMQRNWIGASDGAEVRFDVVSEGRAVDPLVAFTTRPDTLFGVTYVALAAQHPLVKSLTTPDRMPAVTAYCEEVLSKTTKHAVTSEETKTGILTGAYAINPVNGASVPIWVADYVLMDYGTGVVMGVPGHDQRDLEFAKTMGLPIVAVIMPDDEWLLDNAPKGKKEDVAKLRKRYQKAPAEFRAAFVGNGVAINSAAASFSIDGLAAPDAGVAVTGWLASVDAGGPARKFKLRDWLFSRQRFWGEPIPIVFDVQTAKPYPLADSELPLELPHITDFEPVAVEDANSVPTPPLSRAADWVNVNGRIGPDGTVTTTSEPVSRDGRIRQFRRELNTMPNWAGSCWYYLRYMDPNNDRALVDPAIEAYWSGAANGERRVGIVDLYVGGAEHAVLHLLYARFWHKVLYDLGHVSTPEPFTKLFNQGMITADAYHDERGVYVDVHDVELKTIDAQEVAVEKSTGRRLIVQAGKMGKRYKNGTPPEEICDQYSADVLRMYEMYLGPIDASKPWRTADVIGMMRFIERVWRLADRVGGQASTIAADGPLPEAAERARHRVIRKVTEDIARLRMNTALAALIEWTNELGARDSISAREIRTLLLLIAPFACHVAEELFCKLFPDEHARYGSVAYVPWPEFDTSLAAAHEREIVVQVNGKRRASFTVVGDEPPEAIEQQARAIDAVQRHLDGQPVRRVILAPPEKPRLVNFVVG
jgi:leucyl-tRNA synthetase